MTPPRSSSTLFPYTTLFRSADCHKGPFFTDMKLHDIGTVSTYDHPTNRFDTPTLIEVWRSGPYLHDGSAATVRSEEHTSELQSQSNLVCRLLLEQKKTQITS